MPKPKVKLCPRYCGFSTSDPEKMARHLEKIHGDKRKTS